MISENDLSVLLRVIVAVILAGVLGWERESSGKSAGLRTHILVGVSAVLFVAIADTLVLKYQAHEATMRFDPVRIIEAVVTGISFLGAGIIVFRREQGSVRGLTTAAGILTTAAIGALVGLQNYFLAVAATAIVFVVLRFAMYFEVKFLDRKDKSDETNPDSST